MNTLLENDDIPYTKVEVRHTIEKNCYVIPDFTLSIGNTF